MLELRGTVQRLTFHSDETEYTVFRLLPEGQNTPVVCVATLPGIKEGGNLCLRGEWQLHPQYGRRFAVQEMELLLPANVAGMISYLGSGMFKGVRRKRAEAIVQKFGMEALRIVAESPERLVEVGINTKLAAEMQKTLLANRESERLTLYLQSHGLTAKQSLRIYRHYKDQVQGDLVAFVETNPYRLAEEVFGIGFRTADRLALNLNLPPDSPLRLRVGLSYVLSQAAEDGHCYLPEDELLSRAARQLNVLEEGFAPLLEDLLGKRELIAESDPALAVLPGDTSEISAASAAVPLRAEDDSSVAVITTTNITTTTAVAKAQRRIFLPPFYYAEVGVVSRCNALLRSDAPQLGLLQDAAADEAALAALEAQIGITLASEQREALYVARQQPMTIITGGPGTGKTTLLRALLGLYHRQNARVLLAAPTGRAARRLSEVTGVGAATLHRLLEYIPSGPGMAFQRNEDNPLRADVVIVDEASMLDLILFYNLLKALPPGCRLILVGDQDQLPSVGPGQVLRDLIASGTVNTVRLKTVFRQAEQSRIIVNAHRINQGLVPQPGGKDSDFFFIESGDPLKVLEEIVALCHRRLPRYASIDPIEDIQVLCPMRRGVVGVESLNQRLQQVLNPQQSEEAELTSLGDRFRPGDKVMQLRNNYDKGVFNGDIGKVRRVDASNEELWVDYPDGAGQIVVVYRQKDLDELCLAYAISVHKAQGSEYPVVVMPILPEHIWLLQRNLLYTAVTRAKKLLVLIGDRRLLQRTVERAEARDRYTRLAERLRAF